MSLSPFYSFQSRFVTYLLNCPRGCTKFLKFIFGIKLHVLDSSSVHHQEFFTVHTAMVYVIHVCTVKYS